MSSEYPDNFVDRLELLWGPGFLSAGGPAEVREILAGVDVSGKSVLDIGCGTGGPAIVLARDLGAATVTGIDLDEGLLSRAGRHATMAGTDNIAFRQGGAERLDFADDIFDVVFSKEAIIQIADKRQVFREALRVLRPGGVLAASDWLGGENWAHSAEWRTFCDLTGWTSHLATSDEMLQLMEAAGFVRVAARDRNAWYIGEKKRELALIEGPLREKITAIVGEEGHTRWLAVNHANFAAVAVGALRPTHLRGHKAGRPS